MSEENRPVWRLFSFNIPVTKQFLTLPPLAIMTLLILGCNTVMELKKLEGLQWLLEIPN